MKTWIGGDDMEGLDPGIEEAVNAAIRAGIFHRAARLAVKSAAKKVWQDQAAREHEIASHALAGAVERLGAVCGGPCSRCGW